MRIYLSGSWWHRPRLRRWRRRLEAAGRAHRVRVVASWLEEPRRPPGVPKHAWRVERAIRDLQEVHAADIFLLDVFGHSSSGGRYVELGAALAWGRPIWIVGPQEGMFLTLADRRWPDWPTLLKELHHAIRDPRRA